MSEIRLGADHIDLLITAAEAWGVISTQAYDDQVDPTGEPPAVLVATLQSAGIALVHALSDADDECPTGPACAGALGEYRYARVEVLEPVEVLKAAHAVDSAAGRGSGWWDSVAQRIVAGVERAAVERVAGYTEAPWVWTRPATRSGPPLGIGQAWRPELPHLEWLEDPTRLGERWETASLVVVTLEGLLTLPPVLPRRAGVFVIAERAPDELAWGEIVDLGPEAVLWWPENLGWLLEQLRQPAPQFTQHRPEPAAGDVEAEPDVVVGAAPYGAKSD